MNVVREGMEMILLGLKNQKFTKEELKTISAMSLKLHEITEKMLQKSIVESTEGNNG